jgi:hypothetical protein
VTCSLAKSYLRVVSPTRATTPARSRAGSAIGLSRARPSTRRWRRTGSRTSGGIESGGHATRKAGHGGRLRDLAAYGAVERRSFRIPLPILRKVRSFRAVRRGRAARDAGWCRIGGAGRCGAADCSQTVGRSHVVHPGGSPSRCTGPPSTCLSKGGRARTYHRRVTSSWHNELQGHCSSAQQTRRGNGSGQRCLASDAGLATIEAAGGVRFLRVRKHECPNIRSTTSSASLRAARSALSLAAPALMSRPRVLTPMTPKGRT